MPVSKRTNAYASIAEVAKTLDVSEITIRRLISRGELLATRIGTRVRIEWAELERYIARQTIARRTAH